MKCLATILPHFNATLAVLVMFGACSHLAIASKPWSGRVIYDVQPMNTVASEWDYLPQTITYETNGEAWRVTEQGTSFERIWIGAFDALEFSVLFHFLGHAVELLESLRDVCSIDPKDKKRLSHF